MHTQDGGKAQGRREHQAGGRRRADTPGAEGGDAEHAAAPPPLGSGSPPGGPLPAAPAPSAFPAFLACVSTPHSLDPMK